MLTTLCVLVQDVSGTIPYSTLVIDT